MSDARLYDIVVGQPYPHVFVTISGAHLYGFPSPDSDYDLRGTHILPVHEVIGLDDVQDVLTTAGVRDGLEIDLVTHDIKKFFLLLLKKNGYVLEQICSPLVVYTTSEHEELKVIARECITRYHFHHYTGFSESQWKLFIKEYPHRVKPLLYIFRVLLTGIYLMRTGEIEANLVRLNDEFALPYIPDLIARKLAGPEQSVLEDADIAFYRKEYERLYNELEQVAQESTLPEAPSVQTRNALNELLVHLRMKDIS